MTTTPPTFARQDKLKFFRTLNSRVNYFKENNIKKQGTETSFENHYPDHSFFLHLTSNSHLDMPSGFIYC
jgi:hypothetical protein